MFDSLTDLQLVQIGLALFAILSFLFTQITRLNFEKKRHLKEFQISEEKQKLLEKEFLRLSEVSEPLARHLKIELTKNVEWLGEALKRANLGVNTDSLFTERMQHFNTEKKFIAKSFVPILLNRCKHYILEKRMSVTLIIDSGTTTYAFFEEFSREISRIYHSENEWLNEITVATNNLQGTQMIMDIGRVNPRNRFSNLAIKNCFLFPGDLLPIYFAVIGDEAEASVRNLYKKRNSSNQIFLGITTGNWIRIRATAPKCPIPLVRGPRHRAFKQALIESVDEIFVLSPLGKIFRKETQKQVNETLGLTGDPISDQDYGEKQKYLELLIDMPNEENQIVVNPRKVKLISTCRINPGFSLYRHSNAIKVVFETDAQQALDSFSEKIYKEGKINDLPHLLFPFNDLPEIKQFELETEFPHNKTRTMEFMKNHFDVEL